MPNIKMIFQNAVDTIESLTDNHTDPLHIGEAMACWTYYNFVSGALTNVEIGLNTTTNTDVKKIIQDSEKIMKSHQKELSKFLRQEGVPLSDVPAEKPKSEPEAIPLGAKFTDEELMNTLNINFVTAADFCATSASQCLRTDAALMFLKFQTDKLSLGLKSKELGILSLIIEEWIGLIIGASSVVLYLIARKEIAQYEIPGEGIAIAGVILSIMGTLMQVVNVMD